MWILVLFRHPVDSFQLLFKEDCAELELAFDQVLQELLVGRVKVVEEPGVEEV